MRGVAPLAKHLAAAIGAEPAAERGAAAQSRAGPRAAPRRARLRPSCRISRPERRPASTAATPSGCSAASIAIEARLDLHGMTQDEAHRALDAFLARAERAELRCVLVITGKGRPGDQRRGRAACARCRAGSTRRPTARGILAFAAAQPRHGGAGALYLLLRRRR